MTEEKTGADVMAKEEELDALRKDIQSQFKDTQFPDPILEPIYFGRLNKKIVQGKKLIMDTVSGYQYDVVSDLYKIVYHEEVVANLLSALPEEYGKANVTVELYKYGARANVQATFPEMGNFEVNGSPIDPKIVIRNSLDRSLNLVFEWGAVEEVCTNGMTAFVVKDFSKAKHVAGSINKMALKSSIENSLIQFSEQHKLWLGWAEKEVSGLEIKTVMEDLPFTEKEVENMLALPLMNHSNLSITDMGKKTPLWSINSAATQYAAHEIKSQIRKADIGAAIANSMAKSELKLAA